ncbi:MAG: hypothetical protein M3Y56_08465 [Armatimonadota bacterium]|nr:hypothetical protein [Armatimonadota bacterium]
MGSILLLLPYLSQVQPDGRTNSRRQQFGPPTLTARTHGAPKHSTAQGQTTVDPPGKPSTPRKQEAFGATGAGVSADR